MTFIFSVVCLDAFSAYGGVGLFPLGIQGFSIIVSAKRVFNTLIIMLWLICVALCTAGV